MTYSQNSSPSDKIKSYKKKPSWLRVKPYGGGAENKILQLLKENRLHTVCEEATCPNRGECFHKGTATFMIMGSHCTRNCRFCNVTCARPEPLDPEEPKNLAATVKALNLNHVVVTSVTRDDLADGGAAHFAEVVYEIRRQVEPCPSIELLISDLQGSWDDLQTILDSKPDVLNHNLETVPRLYAGVRPQAIYQRSLDLLAEVKKRAPGMLTKSGIMVGLGETKEEVISLMQDLRAIDCDFLTIGQYLQPTFDHLDVVEYIHPDRFEEYRAIGLDLGFKGVASGPFVRSSYMAEDFLNQTLGKKKK